MTSDSSDPVPPPDATPSSSSASAAELAKARIKIGTQARRRRPSARTAAREDDLPNARAGKRTSSGGAANGGSSNCIRRERTGPRRDCRSAQPQLRPVAEASAAAKAASGRASARAAPEADADRADQALKQIRRGRAAGRKSCPAEPASRALARIDRRARRSPGRRFAQRFDVGGRGRRQ